MEEGDFSEDCENVDTLEKDYKEAVVDLFKEKALTGTKWQFSLMFSLLQHLLIIMFLELNIVFSLN
jgi:hypothetical protein